MANAAMSGSGADRCRAGAPVRGGPARRGTARPTRRDGPAKGGPRRALTVAPAAEQRTRRLAAVDIPPVELGQPMVDENGHWASRSGNDRPRRTTRRRVVGEVRTRGTTGQGPQTGGRIAVIAATRREEIGIVGGGASRVTSSVATSWAGAARRSVRQCRLRRVPPQVATKARDGTDARPTALVEPARGPTSTKDPARDRQGTKPSRSTPP